MTGGGPDAASDSCPYTVAAILRGEASISLRRGQYSVPPQRSARPAVKAIGQPTKMRRCVGLRPNVGGARRGREKCPGITSFFMTHR